MPAPRLRVCLLVLAALVAQSLPAAAQGGQNGPKMSDIRLDKDSDIADFLDQIAKTTQKPLLYDPNGQRIKGQKIGSNFAHRVPEERLFDTFRAILAFYELTLIPIGPKGFEFYLVLDSRSTNNIVKNKAVYVDYKELDKYQDQDGLYISCAVPLKFIDNLTVLRSALSNLVSPSGVGRVHEVTTSQSLIIMDFAPTVWAMVQLIKQMDVAPEGKKLVMEFVELQHAYADEVADLISELVAAQRELLAQQRQPQQGVPTTTTPEPRILAYEPKNALVIASTEDDFQMISSLIVRFDQPGEISSTVEVVILKHVAAEDLADTLTQVLEGLGGVIPGAEGGAQPRPGARPAGPSTSRTGGSRSQPLDPQVVPDPGTNALILAADRKTIQALLDIIVQIDKPKDQVLIEATLVSLTRADDFQLGVELAGIDESGLNQSDGTQSGFGVTSFALSTFEDTDGDLIPDINLPTSLATPGGGLVAGIFRNGGIPVLLQAVQRLNNGKILSMPSVVTYDNESATLQALTEQPTGTVNEAASGAVQTGFDSFQPAGVTLTVSPHISADNYLRLDIELEVSSFTGDPPSAGFPSPRTRNIINTTIALPDSHTVVMGGLISEEETVTESKVPILGDVPILGYLFKNKTRRKVKRILFIFVTPHILRQKGVKFSELHRQSWIAITKANELIGKIQIHNAQFFDDPAYQHEEGEAGATLDLSYLVDAGRFQEVPAEQALQELERLRRKEGK
ncbi:MAG: secretin N-terminal domain-containing protein [Planctomycetaceae bacterium]